MSWILFIFFTGACDAHHCNNGLSYVDKTYGFRSHEECQIAGDRAGALVNGSQFDARVVCLQIGVPKK